MRDEEDKGLDGSELEDIEAIDDIAPPYPARSKEKSKSGKTRRRAGEEQDQRTTAGIIDRPEDSYETELEEDPERVLLVLKASKKAALMELLSALALGAVIGYGLFYLLKHKFHFYEYNSAILLGSAKFGPAVFLGVLNIRRFYRNFAKKFELSRRFIRSEFFAGVSIVDSCDMTKVKDVQMTKLGPVSNITVFTKDLTTPVIKMEYIETKLATEAVGFITAHALGSYVEMRTSTRRNRN